MDQAETLLQAHIAFEVKHWTGSRAGKDLEALIGALWEWMEDTCLASVLDADTAVDTALRWVDDWYLPDTVTVLVGSVSKRLIHLPVNTETRLGDVVDEELYRAGVDLIIDLERLRENLIRQATESPLYAMLISNVLYSGIRDYLTSGSGAVQKVPGMGSLLSKGSAALSKRMPGLEGAIEERLRSFIRGNTEKTIRNSRQFLLDALDAEEIRKLADDIWEDAKQTQMTVADLIEDDEIDRLISFGLAIWQELRQTEYIQELIREGIYGFYDAYGDEPLATVLDHVGLSRDSVADEARILLPDLLKQARETGLLERWLEMRLAPFYRSAACKRALRG